jgi:hypothetical protein
MDCSRRVKNVFSTETYTHLLTLFEGRQYDVSAGSIAEEFLMAVPATSHNKNE